MKQDVVRGVLEREWPAWWEENREQLRGHEAMADLRFVSHFLEIHPEFLEWSKTKGRGISAKSRLELWADKMCRASIRRENAEMGFK